MTGFWKGYWTGAVVCGVVGPVIGHYAFPHKDTNADIGIRFEDSAKAATLRDYNALPDATIKQALDEAFNNYRAGKESVIVVKLPTAVPAPGK